MTAEEYWKERFDEYPKNDSEKLAVAMMQEYTQEVVKNLNIPAVIQRSEQLIDFLKWYREEWTIPEYKNDENTIADYLFEKSINESLDGVPALSTNEHQEKNCHNTPVECKMYLNFGEDACEKCDKYY